jgi:hypothetical protein
MDFEQLSKLSPRMEFLGDGMTTNFWEELYKLFRRRANEEDKAAWDKLTKQQPTERSE